MMPSRASRLPGLGALLYVASVFGRKHKLQARLEAGELRRVEADVLKTHHLMGTSGMATEGTGEFRVHVRITPPGEEPFEASLNYFTDVAILGPHEGSKLPVAYDPEDRDAVIWDERTARDAWLAKSAFDRERRERIAAERREQGLPPVESPEAGPDPDLVAKLQALQARKDCGELSDWDFRAARAEIFKEKGF